MTCVELFLGSVIDALSEVNGQMSVYIFQDN